MSKTIFQNKKTHSPENPSMQHSTAEDGAQDVLRTSVLRRPKRSGNLEPWVQGTLRFENKKRVSLAPTLFCSLLRKMGLEPTRCNHHKILSLARLPVPTLPRSVVVTHATNDILTLINQIVNTLFLFFSTIFSYNLPLLFSVLPKPHGIWQNSCWDWNEKDFFCKNP